VFSDEEVLITIYSNSYSESAKPSTKKATDLRWPYERYDAEDAVLTSFEKYKMKIIGINLNPTEKDLNRQKSGCMKNR
jgi:hypothetical protein